MTVTIYKQLIEDTPEIMQVMISQSRDFTGFLAVVEAAADNDFFYSKEGDATLMKKVNSKAYSLIRGIEDAQETLTYLHKFFDLLLRKNEAGLIAAEFEKYRYRGYSEDDIINGYFEELAVFKTTCEEAGKLNEYIGFGNKVKEQLTQIQKLYNLFLTKKNIANFTAFENDINRLSSESYDVAVITYQKLPALSKLKKDDLIRLTKELNLFSYEDSLRILEVVSKKYKFYQLSQAVKAKMCLVVGYDFLQSVNDAPHYFNVEELFAKTSIHPQFPYFPYKAQTQDALVDEIRVDVSRFYGEDDINPLILLKSINLASTSMEIQFDLTEAEEKRFFDFETALYTVVNDHFNLTKEDYTEAYRWNMNVVRKKFEFPTIQFEGLEYGAVEAHSLLNRPFLKMRGLRGDFEGNVFFNKGFARSNHTIDSVYAVTLQKAAYHFFGRTNPALYQESIEECAEWYQLSDYYRTESSKVFENEFFKDVLFYQIRHKMLGFETLQIISGEKYSRFSPYEIGLRQSIQQAPANVQESLVEITYEMLKEELIIKDFQALCHGLHYNSSLGYKYQLLLAYLIKPTAFSNLVAFKQLNEMVDLSTAISYSLSEKADVQSCLDTLDEEALRELAVFLSA